MAGAVGDRERSWQARRQACLASGRQELAGAALWGSGRTGRVGGGVSDLQGRAQVLRCGVTE